MTLRTPLRKRLYALAIVLLLPALLGSVGMAYNLFPYNEILELPTSMRAFSGESELTEKIYSKDFSVLSNQFEPQIHRSFCGVASSVIVLNAMGIEVSQDTFFENDDVSAIRPWLTVYFAGMPLHDLSRFLQIYNTDTKLTYSSDVTVEEFRQRVTLNAQNPHDFMIVNYSRTALGQAGGGHISPIGAYRTETDEILVLDVAIYRYPWTWVKLEDLFLAMNTIDGGRSRGFVEIAQQYKKP